MQRRIKPYSYIADIYLHLMNFIDYKEWAEYYFLLTKNMLSSESKILELACGNCKLSTHLKKYYENIIVSDISLEMLKKKSEAQLNRICCDMNYLPFKKGFDFIFSAFDSLNYLLTKKALNNLFVQVYSLLKNNGIFSFDVSMENNSIKNIRFLNRKRNYDGIRYTQKSFYDYKNRIHLNRFILKYPDGNVYEEMHQQKIYPREVYFDLLIKSGFYIQNCFNAFTFSDASDKSFRIQFVAIKK